VSGKAAFVCIRRSGGRTWWAHFEFRPINIEPIIHRKKFEDVREAGVTPAPPVTDRLRLARCLKNEAIRSPPDSAVAALD
jgi:hypothetical protein